MSIVLPFAGLRPSPEKVLQVACPPYDVVNTAEARAYARGNPLSFFHVSRPEIALPDGADPHTAEVYALGRTALDRFVAEGVLQPDSRPCLYLYRQTMGAHTQVGLVAAASVAEYRDGRIKKHELTRADKEDDRTHHIDALDAHDEPVFLTYEARPEIDARVQRLTGAAPAYDFVTSDGIGHTFWVVDSAEEIAALQAGFREIPALYIADGHHRSAAAARVCEAREKLPGHTGEEGYNAFLTVIFPHDQMQILDYNRVVADLNGLTPEAFLARVEEKFEVRESEQQKPLRTHDFGMLLEGRWYQLTARPGSFDEADPVRRLDVSILQENLLAPVLGIGDPRRDQRIDFVGGIRGTKELERLVREGRAKVAFAMFPTGIAELMAIADAGEIMPPKSTWFEPKLRSGLVVHRM